MRTCKPGDKLTCLHPVEAYGSDYGPSLGTKIVFSPGMVAIVACITAKVRICYSPDDPAHDRRETFIVADYTDEDGVVQRVGLNFCNTRKVK